MAKSKKSKILASMLAVSTMAVFYATPVMAGDGIIQAGTDVGGIKINIESEDYGQDGTADSGNYMYYHYDGVMGSQSKVSGQLFISSENIAKALKGQDVTFGAVTADTISAASGAFEVNSEGIVDAASFNATTGDITTNKYSLNTVGDLTQNIDSTRTTAGTTTFKGEVNVDGNVKAATGSFDRMTLNGQRVLAANHVLTVGDETLNFRKANQTIENTAGIERVDYGNGVGETTIEGATTFDQSGMGVYTSTGTSVVSGGQATFRDNSGGFTQIMGGDITASGSINVAGSSNIGGVGFDGGIVTAERMTLNGSDIYAGGHVLKVGDQTLNFLLANRAIENTAGIERVDYGNGVGETTIEGATTFDQSGMGVYTSTGTSVVSGGQATFTDKNGSFTQIMGGDITAETLNGKNINDLVVGSDIADDLSNIAGIERETLVDGSGITTIEGATSFDQGGMSINTANGTTAIVGGEATFNDGSGITQISGGDVMATGDVISSYNGEQYSLNTIGANTAGIERETLADGSGITTIEEATSFDQGGMSIATNSGTTAVSGGQATFTDKNGSFTQIMGGDITAETLNGKNIDDLVVGSDITNIGGINRVDSNEDGTLDTTIIENTLAVSENEVSAVTGDTGFIMNDNYLNLQHGFNTGITLSDNGIDLNGDVYFTGHDDKRYTLSDLEGRVYDLEQKTQNITSADPGQGGGSEVPPTGEGHTGFEGDVTVDNDVTVGNDLTVGGDANIDGNANVSGNVNVDGQINVGSTVVDKNGITAENGTFTNVTVGGEKGVSIKDDGITVGGENGTVISDSDVVINEGTEDRVSLSETAGRVDNLEQGVAELNNRVGELEDRIDKVGAMAAAIANLRTMGYDPAAPTEVAVGIGQYRDETGAALGLFHYPNRDFMLSLSVSTSGDEVMGGIGATWKFGRKSPEKVAEIKKAQAEADARIAEEAKLAKAEEMKQAAKEAKIKAQQERHAKLAAERAAQAEAAK